MPEIKQKTLPNWLFSTSDEAVEARILSLPNSMLRMVDHSLEELMRATGIQLIVVEKSRPRKINVPPAVLAG